MIHISNGNSKLGTTKNISLPPIKTCAPDVPCAKDCYACKHAYNLYPNVRKNWDENLEAYNKAPGLFFDDIATALRKARKPGLWRWFVGGDCPDLNFLVGIVSIARSFPEWKFLMFSKRYDLLQEWDEQFGKIHVPSNLRIVVSAWPGYKLPKRLQKKYPVAYLLDKKDPDKRIPEGTPVCPGTCETCNACWHMEKGAAIAFEKH